MRFFFRWSLCCSLIFSIFLLSCKKITTWLKFTSKREVGDGFEMSFEPTWQWKMEAFEYSPSGKLTYHLKDPQNSWLDDDFPSTIVPFQGTFSISGAYWEIMRNSYWQILLKWRCSIAMLVYQGVREDIEGRRCLGLNSKVNHINLIFECCFPRWCM